MTANSVCFLRPYVCRAVLSLQQNQEGGAEARPPVRLVSISHQLGLGCHGWMSLHGPGNGRLKARVYLCVHSCSSIFGRCIFLVSVVSQLPLNSSAHTAAAYVWGPGPPQGARGHLQPWPHSGSLALRRHAVPTVHLKEVGPVAPLPKRAHTFSS